MLVVARCQSALARMCTSAIIESAGVGSWIKQHWQVRHHRGQGCNFVRRPNTVSVGTCGAKTPIKRKHYAYVKRLTFSH